MQEISSANLAQLQLCYRSAAIIVSAQIFLTLGLLVLTWFFTPASGNSISQQTLMTLWAAMIFVAIGTFVLRRMFFRWDRLKDVTLLKGISGLLKTLQTNAIVLGALAEAIAVIGFVITVLNGERFEMLRAGIVALIVFSINFPRKAVWEKIVAGLQEI